MKIFLQVELILYVNTRKVNVKFCNFWPNLHKLYPVEKTGVFFGNFAEKMFHNFQNCAIFINIKKDIER
mgnify:FL=1